MNWLDRILAFLTRFLETVGVPEGQRSLAALGLLYAGAILLVLLLVLVIWRLRRSAKKTGEGAAPAEEEAPSPPEEFPGAEAEVEVGEEAEAEIEAETAAVPEVEQEVPEKEEEVAARPEPTLFERMRTGLAKTQSAVVGRIDSLLRGRPSVDEEFLEDLEEILITADFGMQTTQELVSAVEARLGRGQAAEPDQVRGLLKDEIRKRLLGEAAPIEPAAGNPFVIMVVGVNGVGKTTTIGKLAWQLASQGKKVVLGAGDTFRAAAAEQLAIWGERAGVDVIRHAEGADPAAVAFDAAKAALARQADILILDTAGRLHTKVNLMEELKKIRRVLDREIPGAPQETLLVLDATTGQNALSQARLFKEAVEVTGLALTKLDGTAKGGIVVAIGADLGLPVRYVGIGEGVEDLRPFDPDLFVDALFPNVEKP